MISETSPAQQLKQLAVIYSALFLGILVIAGVAALLVSQSIPNIEENPARDQLVLFIAIGMAILLIFMAHAIPQAMLKKFAPDVNLIQKLEAYRKANIVKLALIEGAAIIASTAFVVTKNTNMLLLVAIVVLFLILNRPTKFKTASDLQLSAEETDQLSRG
jgi:Ca2+/Na+ antiporter